MIALLVAFVVFLAMGVPIAFVLGWSSLFFSCMNSDSVFIAIPLTMFSGVNQFVFLAIPLFLLSGDLMVNTGIMDRLVKFCMLLLGRIRGSLAHVAILASMIFAGISGSAVADAAALGSVLIPAMSKQYNREFATGVVTAASIIGPIIPPSVPMIIYSMSVGGLSIAGLFLSGVIPGVMIGVGMMAIVYIQAVRKGFPPERRQKLDALVLLKAFWEVLPALLMPVIILGGILSGICTATESAAISVLYVLLVGFFLTKNLTWKIISRCLLQAAKMSSIVFLLIATASVLAWMLTEVHFPEMAAERIRSVSSNPIVFLMLLNVFLLFVGCILEPASAMVMLMPIISPIANDFGIHPLHLGIVVVVNLCIGLITPPVGTCLFVGCGISKLPMQTVVKAMFPYMLVQLFVLLLITYFPGLALVVPSWFGIG